MSIQEILKLPQADRLQLIEQIWDSIETRDIEISSAQKRELDRRRALHKAGKMISYTMDEVKEKLKSKR